MLEDLIPKHLPIKVKIRKEKEPGFKKIDTERWLRDFELELTNTGDKPIYFLKFFLKMPEIKAVVGMNLLFDLSYGRRELSDIQTKANPDDVPIKPGETHVFKNSSRSSASVGEAVREENRPQPKVLQIVFQKLSFGDGTGFARSDGQALPQKRSKQPNLTGCLDQPNKAGPEVPRKPSPRRRPSISSTFDRPASFLAG